jgi:hypothetical protein
VAGCQRPGPRLQDGRLAAFPLRMANEKAKNICIGGKSMLFIGALNFQEVKKNGQNL